MERLIKAEDTRDLILDTQRPIDTFQENLEALRRSVEDIGDIHAVLTRIFIENHWDVSRLYQPHRLDIYRGFPGWFVDHKIARCYYQAKPRYRFVPHGNVVTSGEDVYEDLEKCDRVAYKSTFETGFLAGILTSFIVLVLVGLATRGTHRTRLYFAFSISVACFVVLYSHV